MISNPAILFPGQGAQRRGMDVSVLETYSELLTIAEEISGFSIRDFFIRCPPEQFSYTRYVQPALYTLNALYYRHYLESGGIPPIYLAGHSLGEFNALQAASVFDFEAGLRLVNKRALLMSESQGGGMAAVMGLNADEVFNVITKSGHLGLSLANLNSDIQTVISGPIASIHLAESIFYDNDALNYVILNVSGAFHSPMLDIAAEKFYDYVQGFSFSPPKIPVIANGTAKPYSHTSLAKNLANQINNPVRWRESVIYIRQHGVAEFIEIGDNCSILLDMIKNIEINV
ncbi:acyltransferase domain-containing protein [Serratia fonticola]|uniref:Malonyl CoA-acyl carrier protein transacylase n=1 Tax=Serratia fonticola TaxID=47917 RepID=A0AAW3WX34_SERFO|nr:ACP S-malonyltransferase [Serratia fonticola]MBC3215885.1 ACP S-malonyltransferase [Serratia fonticola]NYA16408.1 ACP S-malonyltransferase [Serratia fonticola]NYA36547.1 ACP S-malonyltransferase [Serratia fonticola]